MLFIELLHAISLEVAYQEDRAALNNHGRARTASDTLRNRAAWRAGAL